MTEKGQLIAVHTDDAWKQQLQNGKDSKKLIVVDFTAAWCGPCRIITPVLEEIARNTPELIFLKVDVDELRSVAETYSIEAMPTFLFLKDGEIVDKVVGAKKEELQLTIAKHASAAASSS